MLPLIRENLWFLQWAGAFGVTIPLSLALASHCDKEAIRQGSSIGHLTSIRIDHQVWRESPLPRVTLLLHSDPGEMESHESWKRALDFCIWKSSEMKSMSFHPHVVTSKDISLNFVFHSLYLLQKWMVLLDDSWGLFEGNISCHFFWQKIRGLTPLRGHQRFLAVFSKGCKHWTPLLKQHLLLWTNQSKTVHDFVNSRIFNWNHNLRLLLQREAPQKTFEKTQNRSTLLLSFPFPLPQSPQAFNILFIYGGSSRHSLVLHNKSTFLCLPSE